MSYKNYDPFFDEEPDNEQSLLSKSEINENIAAVAENNIEQTAEKRENVTPIEEIFNANVVEQTTESREPIAPILREDKPTESNEPTNFDPSDFFGEHNGNNNNSYSNNYNNNNTANYVNNDNNSTNSNNRDDNFDYGRFSDGGNYSNGRGTVKVKKRAGLGLILAIMIPILIITNIVTSVFVFNNVWADARTEFEAKLDSIVSKENNLVSGGSSAMLSYNIANQEMQSVVEIYSTYASGSSAGTGFIVTTDGYILTNAHVVTYAAKSYSGIGPGGAITTTTQICEKVVIQFEGNETQYKVEVIAYDTSLDIAVLKMETPPANLRAVRLADSTLLAFGEPCVAIGNAKGYGLAVTEGVISSPIQYYNLTSRDNALTAAVQHSAAINPGNSGGPLFNMYGLVVGINSFKLTQTSSDVAIDGMGFAIPSAVVKDYVNGLGIQGLSLTYTANPVANIAA